MFKLFTVVKHLQLKFLGRGEGGGLWFFPQARYFFPHGTKTRLFLIGKLKIDCTKISPLKLG